MTTLNTLDFGLEGTRTIAGYVGVSFAARSRAFFSVPYAASWRKKVDGAPDFRPAAGSFVVVVTAGLAGVVAAATAVVCGAAAEGGAGASGGTRASFGCCCPAGGTAAGPVTSV